MGRLLLCAGAVILSLCLPDNMGDSALAYITYTVDILLKIRDHISTTWLRNMLRSSNFHALLYRRGFVFVYSQTRDINFALSDYSGAARLSVLAVGADVKVAMIRQDLEKELYIILNLSIGTTERCVFYGASASRAR